MASFIAAGQIRALADMAGVKIDIVEGKKGKNSVDAFVKKAVYELSLFSEEWDYAPLGEALEALKKRVYQELLKVEGFAKDGEFRFMDTGGITSVPIEDGRVVVRGRIYYLEDAPDGEEGESIAYPNL